MQQLRQLAALQPKHSHWQNPVHPDFENDVLRPDFEHSVPRPLWRQVVKPLNHSVVRHAEVGELCDGISRQRVYTILGS